MTPSRPRRRALRFLRSACALIAVSVATWSLPVAAANGYSISNTITQQIVEHSVCRKVTNALAGGKGLYVPTKYDTEWNNGAKAFLNNVISGVSLAACLDAASLRFKSANSTYFSRTPASASNRRTRTFSFWMKRTLISFAGDLTLFDAGTGNTNDTRVRIGANDAVEVLQYNGSYQISLQTPGMLRDPAAWTHVVIAFDTTAVGQTDRVKMYLNGVQQIIAAGSSGSLNWPSQNLDLLFNSTSAHAIGKYTWTTSPFDGYLADVYFVDGQALAPSAFAETDADTNQWIPKPYTGTYGTNGFHLTFANPASLGNDSSGGAKHWAPNNFSTTAGVTYDPMLDYASGSYGGNYATFNPVGWVGSAATLLSGNLQQQDASGVGAWKSRWSTIGMTSGKWYAEFTYTFAGAGNPSGYMGVGLHDGQPGTTYAGQNATSFGYMNDGNKYNGSAVNTGVPYAAGDIIQLAYDADAGKFWTGKNGAWVGGGSPAAGTSALWAGVNNGQPKYSSAHTYWVSPDGNANMFANFGQRAFTYTPPTGFRAPSTINLPAPVITTPTVYFKTVTYTGNGLFTSIGTPLKLSGGATIPYSAKMRGAVNYLSRTWPATPGNLRTWTWSGWVKRTSFGINQYLFSTADNNTAAGNYAAIKYESTDGLSVFSYATGHQLNLTTSQLSRDPSKWMHVVVAIDTTQATAANRAKVYVDGRQATSLSAATYPALNATLAVNNNATVHRIGAYGNVGTGQSSYFDGYLSDVYFVDGQQLDANAFGQFNSVGVWVPATYGGAYGTNGFHLDFSNAGALGTDSSGNGNAWTLTGVNASDQMIDTPTNNFPVANQLDKNASISIWNGGQQVASGAGNIQGRSTIGVTSGKWYWEFFNYGTAVGNTGIATAFTNLSSWGGSDAYGWAYHMSNGQVSNNGSVVGYGSTWGGSNVVGVALDADTGKIWFAKDNVWQFSGDPATGANPAYSNVTGGPFYATFGGNSGAQGQFNFGAAGIGGTTWQAAAGGYFKYTPPAGFLAVNTQNISNTDFVPDLVWIKGRSGATAHALYDSARGATLDFTTTATTAETVQSTGLLGFNAGGFDIGSLAKLNTNATTYVAIRRYPRLCAYEVPGRRFIAPWHT